MKILAIGDPHGKLPKNLDKIIKKNKPDLIICTGDWGFTPKKAWIEESWKNLPKNYAATTAKKILRKLDSYNLFILSLKGNMFISKKGIHLILPQIKKMKNFIQKYTGKYKIQDYNFIFFDIIYEQSTLRAHNKNTITKNKMKSNESRKNRLNKLLKKNKNSILISHNPPYGYVDKAYNGKHVGSMILLNAIKKHQPKYVFCGHIHEARGKAKIGKTIVYNLGFNGDYLVLDTDKNKILDSNFLK
jgi:Icc-related predicted phosphoesterase